MSNIKILPAENHGLDSNALGTLVEKKDYEAIVTETNSEGGKLILRDQSFYIKKNHVLIKIFLDDISHINIEGRYSEISTVTGNYIVQQSLKSLTRFFSAHNFIRIHRNHLINTDKIDKVYLKDNVIILKNQVKLNVGNQYKRLFLEKNIILV